MSWYYAENNERRGPIEDAAFDALVAQGTVRPDTLVWREGMDNWVPLNVSGHTLGATASAGAPADPATGTAPRIAEEMGVCSESGRILPRSELVEINGRLVSAEYKNIVLQRIREGVGGSGEAADPEALAQAIEQRGYEISIGSCISRGWSVVKSRFWLVVGATFLTMLVSQAAGIIPAVGPLLVFGPITAGMYWIMILILRNEPVSIGDAFMGFSRSFGQYLGFTGVIFGAVFACLLPGVLLFIAGTSMNASSGGGMVLLVIGVLLLVVGSLAMIYFWTAWIFALPLIADKQIEFWPAMKLSRRIVGMHWWSIFGVIFCTGLVIGGIFLGFAIIAGILIAILGALQVGEAVGIALGVVGFIAFFAVLLAVMPLTYATVAVAYNDIFGQPQRR